MKKPETIIEDTYCDWLLSDYPFNALAIKLILFAGKGFPDRTILSRGRILFIEFKAPGKPPDSLDPLQHKWRKLLYRLGFKVYVCTSVRQAKRVTYQVLGRT